MCKDPFPLVEETTNPTELPTLEEWLGAGAPMREVGCGHDGWVKGCPICEGNEAAAREAMGDG